MQSEPLTEIHTMPHDAIWQHVLTVAPLVVIGTRDADGTHNFAPKHMAMRLSWNDHYGFVCTPEHRTYQNIARDSVFTVSYPRPNQIIMTSLAADQRTTDDVKPALAALPVFPARTIYGVFLQDAYLFLECRLERMIDGLADNSLVIGRIVAAHVSADALINDEREANDMLAASPLLAYLDWGHFARIDKSAPFPFLSDFKR
jgi:flavin reductase (DIM6/NTAB) family NADH-FMN oxidoreductase RutF